MKFFNWVQNRLNGGQPGTCRNPNPVPPSPSDNRKQDSRNQEFSDWPESLLAIGTLGNTNHPAKNAQKPAEVRNEIVEEEDDEQCSSPDLAEFTPEEFGKLQKVLTKLLSRKAHVSKAEALQANNAADLPLDRFLNCPSNLDVDRRLSNTSTANSSTYDYDDDEIDRTIRAIIGRCRDVCEKKKQKGIGKKSVSFLVKKIFACGSSGFAPAPSLRDTFQESRMEKLLRTMISKKIYRQNSWRVPSKRRVLEDKRISRAEEEEETEGEKTRNSGKWDKTDSEYIVLEI